MKLFLHIGTGKTGTSYVQARFAQTASELLQEHQLLWPETGRVEHRHREVRAVAERLVDPADFVGRLRTEFDRSNAVAAYLSDENLCRIPAVAVRHLAAVLRPIADIRIVLWLRNQVDFIRSSWQEGVKHGFSSELGRWVRSQDARHRMNYAAIIRDWSCAFGEDAMTIVSFDEVVARGYDLYSFQRSLFTGQKPAQASDSRRVNAAMGAPETELLVAINQELELITANEDSRHCASRKAFVWLREVLAGEFSSIPCQLESADIAWVESHYQRQNDHINENCQVIPPGSQLRTSRRRRSDGNKPNDLRPVAPRLIARLVRDEQSMRERPLHFTEPLAHMIPARETALHRPLRWRGDSLTVLLLPAATDGLIDALVPQLTPAGTDENDRQELWRDEYQRSWQALTGTAGDRSGPAAEFGVVTMLRDPVERVCQRWLAGDKKARRELIAGVDADNGQSRALAFVADVPMTALDPMGVLELAKQQLEYCACFGIHERPEESAELFAHTFGLSVEFPTANPPQDPDDELAEAVNRRNQVDSELYRFANTLFDARLRLMREEQSATNLRDNLECE